MSIARPLFGSCGLALLASALAAFAPAAGPPPMPDGGARPVTGFDVPRTKIYEDQYRLLINIVVLPGRGCLVASLSPGTPTTHMTKVGSPNVRGELEPGDVITHVNGRPVQTLPAYYEAMNQSGGEVTITVIDKNTGRAMDWHTKAVKAQTPILPPEPPVPGGGVTRAILIGLTNDRSIGEGAKTDLRNVEKLLRAEVARDRLDLEVVSGADCNARAIIGRVRQLGQRAKPGDTIFCYYSGHGAYDPRYESGDPSGGHYFAIPDGDLLRRTVVDNLLAQPGRLKVLVSDTCNVKSTASVAGRVAYEQSSVEVRGPTPLEQLLLHHRGVVDLAASSRGQFSWSNAEIGGWFTHNCVRVMPGYADWQPFVGKLAVESNAFYLRRRESILANPAGHSPDVVQALRNQTGMNPAVFRMAVAKDAAIPSGPPRTIVRTVPSLVVRD